MRDKTVCFTGHRDIPLLKKASVSKHLRTVVIELIKEGYVYYGAGGALGFDTIAAKTILDLKREYPNIKLILVLPCHSQADRWSERDKIIYEEIKAKADKVVFVSQEYTRDCMFRRNRHLVDNSSVCVCYLTEEKGGTAYTVSYAKKNNLKVINVAK